MYSLEPQVARRIVSTLQWRFPQESSTLIRDLVLRVAAADARAESVIDQSTAILRQRNEWANALARFEATRKEARKTWARR